MVTLIARRSREKEGLPVCRRYIARADGRTVIAADTVAGF